ncbi:MAG: response regulator [Oligoflexales bacterium]
MTSVLIVDDKVENLKALYSILKPLSLNVHLASSGPQALELFLEQEFTLALIDVNMPEMSGFELAGIIRGRRRYEDFPIIFVSATDRDNQMIFEGYEKGAVDFLYKPLDPHVTRSKIRTFVELSSARNALTKRLQELEQLKDRAEIANRLKSRFLMNVSHEIRTPLSAIMSYAELAREPQVVEQEKSKFIDGIIENSKHLTQLIDDILDLSNIESDNVVVNPSLVTMDDIFKKLGSMFESRAINKNLDLCFKINGDARQSVKIDPTRLKQVLSILIDNAIKFTRQGSVCVESDLIPKGGYHMLKISVEDTGPGIAQENYHKIFEPFSQLDDSTTRLYGGTGLGLTIARKVMDSVGGKIRLCQGMEQKGCRFELEFAVETGVPSQIRSGEASTRPISQQINPEALRDVKVLLIDDSKHVRNFIKRILELSGAKVSTAESGYEGIDYSKRESFDIILLDIQMPGIDGFETLAQLKAGKVASPVIAFTAHAMEEERQKCLAAGFSAHLTKPVEIKNLIDTVLNNLPESTLQKPSSCNTTNLSYH